MKHLRALLTPWTIIPLIVAMLGWAFMELLRSTLGIFDDVNIVAVSIGQIILLAMTIGGLLIGLGHGLYTWVRSVREDIARQQRGPALAPHEMSKLEGSINTSGLILKFWIIFAGVAAVIAGGSAAWSTWLVPDHSGFEHLLLELFLIFAFAMSCYAIVLSLLVIIPTWIYRRIRIAQTRRIPSSEKSPRADVRKAPWAN